MVPSSSPDAAAWEWGGRTAWVLCTEGASEWSGPVPVPWEEIGPKENGPLGKGVVWPCTSPSDSAQGPGDTRTQDPLEEGPGCPTGLVRRLFQGHPLFLVQFPQGPLQLLTILFSICKSFNVENCHPESDSVGCWRPRRLELGCLIPAPQQGCLPPGHTQPHLEGSPGSQKPAVPHLPRRAA